MTDKELYNHFKTRSHTLDEKPGDALWNSIADKMDSKSASSKKRLLFFIISGVIVLGLAIYMIIPQNKNALPQKPNLPEQGIVATDTASTSTKNEIVVTEQEATKKSFTESKTSRSINTSNVSLKPKAQKASDTKSSVLKSRNSTSKDAVKLSEVHFTSQIELDSLKGIPFNTALDTVKPSGIKVATQKYDGRILIQAKEKISQSQFDSLVSASFNTYKKEYNTMLIVRAPGLTPYRERITKYTPKPGMDTLSTVKPEFVRFTPIYEKQLESPIVKEAFIKSGEVSNDNRAAAIPQYPGGIDMFIKHLSREINIPDAAPSGVYKIFTHLDIATDGSISDIKIMKPAGYGLDEAIIEAVKKIKTKWEPVIIDGKPSNSGFAIPITITIR